MVLAFIINIHSKTRLPKIQIYQKKMPKILHLEKPADFNFKYTIFSHGWSQLLPFEVNRENLKLNYVFTGENQTDAVYAEIGEADGKIEIEIFTNKINRNFEDKIVNDTKHILQIDEDLSGFYQLTKKHKRLGWIAENGAGRLLRSPTVFEDLIKTVGTTNCSWALTKKMVTNLVEKLGTPAENGKRAFPTAEAMAKKDEKFYREEIRAGYRSAYFAEIARSVADEKINPENWLDSTISTVELKKEIKKIKGVGNYAAENLLKLVGRSDGLALDSMLRSRFYKKHNNGIICEDEQISEFYKEFGTWRGLAIWCDITER